MTDAFLGELIRQVPAILLALGVGIASARGLVLWRPTVDALQAGREATIVAKNGELEAVKASLQRAWAREDLILPALEKLTSAVEALSDKRGAGV